MDRIESHGDKGNIFRTKLERSFLQKCFLMCEFPSPSYSFLFIELIVNTVFVESTKGYMERQEAHGKKGHIIR